MRIATLLCVLLSLSVVSAKEDGTPSQSQDQPKIPTTLAEAHAELERMLPSKELAEIDAMASEDDMSLYHMGLGMGIRNSWGLWAGGPLAKHMQELGFTHPDDMSGVILETFWCKRHGKDFRLKERAAGYREFAETQQNAEKEQEDRNRKAYEAMRNMMMGLRFEKRDVPAVPLPARGSGLNVRSLSRLRDGVFITAYCQGSVPSDSYVPTDGYYTDPTTGEYCMRPDMDDRVARGFCFDQESKGLRKMKPGEDVHTQGWYFDWADRKTYWIRLAEIDHVCSAVVAGDRAWFAGMGNSRAVLVGVGDRDRVILSLPQEDEIPDLGVDGQSLLAVYSKSIFVLADGKWTLVHSGDILLPHSGLPAQRHGNMVFLRDEGRGERCKRLWWLTFGEQPHLSVLERDTGLVGDIVWRSAIIPDMEMHLSTGPSGWDEVSSYCVTTNGDLWACVAGGTSLLRRAKDGHYSIAIMNGSVQFTEDSSRPGKDDPDLSVSAITPLPDDTLLLVGRSGLYRLRDNELVQELAFTAQQDRGPLPINARGPRLSPNTILAIDEQSYFIGSQHWEGICLLRKSESGQWSFEPLDEKRNDPIMW